MRISSKNIIKLMPTNTADKQPNNEGGGNNKIIETETTIGNLTNQLQRLAQPDIFNPMSYFSRLQHLRTYSEDNISVILQNIIQEENSVGIDLSKIEPSTIENIKGHTDSLVENTGSVRMMTGASALVYLAIKKEKIDITTSSEGIALSLLLLSAGLGGKAIKFFQAKKFNKNLNDSVNASKSYKLDHPPETPIHQL